LAQNDPWEATNRDIFNFDLRLDRVIARPIAKGYRSVVPELARQGVHTF
jgi:phospholipid-binding lipoprotein MlaA